MTKPPQDPVTSPALLLTIQTVAERLGVSTKTIRRLIQAKSIIIHRIGRQIRISEADLAAYVRSQRDM